MAPVCRAHRGRDRTFTLAALTSLISALLAIDEDSTWYLNVVERQLRLRGQREESDTPGVVFLEIDGLAHDVLRRALTNGSAPTLAGGSAKAATELERWETDWSSQTGACQAGLLHGNNHDMPAFRWWEKDRPARSSPTIRATRPRSSAGSSDGAGLLARRRRQPREHPLRRRAALAADDEHRARTTARALGQDYFAYFARPYAVIKTAVFSVIEVFTERVAATRQERDGVKPRIKRNWSYAVMRAWATVIQLDLQVAAVIGDILAGRPAIYTTFLAYDEVAHHSGIERPDALKVLRKVDRQIGRIVDAADFASRPYRFVVLSDHGQSQGTTFLDRYGVSLEDLVSDLCRGAEVAPVGGGEDDARAYLHASVAETDSDDNLAARTLTRAGRSGEPGRHAEDPDTTDSDAPPELSVMASGCLGLISFPREPGRITLEQIEELHPDLIPGLRAHPGIGFLLVRSDADGAVAIGPSGINYLDRDWTEGEDPLKPFGPNAAAHVKRTDSFPHCADIMVNSAYWDDLDEVAAFEELVGSHGGLGGTQCFPFVLHPADLEWPREQVVGAEGVYHVLKAWQAQLAGGGSRVESPGSNTRTSVSGE